MLRLMLVLVVVPTLFGATPARTVAPVSEETQPCLDCHEIVTPGIVADWRQSRMSRVTPAAALGVPAVERRMSVASVPEQLSGHVVGCYECHGLNPDGHPDSFDHFDMAIHTVVSPADCATCHPAEVEQYSQNLMSQAYGNLVDNPV